MSKQILQVLLDRVDRLEEELRLLKTLVGKDKEAEKPWWEKIAGSHKDHKVFDEIVRLGRQIREAERTKTRADGANPKKGLSRRKKRSAAKE